MKFSWSKANQTEQIQHLMDNYHQFVGVFLLGCPESLFPKKNLDFEMPSDVINNL
jgi:hypothetical protein